MAQLVVRARLSITPLSRNVLMVGTVTIMEGLIRWVELVVAQVLPANNHYAIDQYINCEILQTVAIEGSLQ